jgi:DNA repair protein RadC
MSNNADKPSYPGHRSRIRDRFLKHGLDPFQDYEALELLLTYAISRKDVKPVAKRLIERFGSYKEVMDAGIDELLEVKGVGLNSAVLLKLIKASTIRYLKEKILHKPVISSPMALLDYCRLCMEGLKEEQFRVIFLNTKNEVLAEEIIQQGTIDQATVYPRKIIERALAQKAKALIFVHNHPSGDPTPSQQDRQLTRDLLRMTQDLGIRVHDHLIVGQKGHFSFKEKDLL